MIGKGKFFDLISRTAEDMNKPELSISEIMRNFHIREDKYNIQVKSFDSRDIEER